MYDYIVVSYKPENTGILSNFTNYYVGFDDEDEAREFLNTEEYDFRVRELYDCTNGLPQDFIDDWCFEHDRTKDYTIEEAEELDIQAENSGYYWKEDLEEYVKLQN